MPKYLIEASYSHEGFEGVRTKGGSKSARPRARETAKSLGGKLEAFYFAFGEHDAVVILDLPDNEAAAAVALAVDAAGGAKHQDDRSPYPAAGRRCCETLDRLGRLPPAGDRSVEQLALLQQAREAAVLEHPALGLSAGQ